VLVPVVELRDDLVLQDGIERLGVGTIRGRVVSVLLPVADRPPDFG